MKRTKTMRYAAAVAFLITMWIGVGPAKAQQANEPSDAKFRMEGGWLFTVTVPAGTPGPAQFQALDSYAMGGGWSGHASTDASNAVNWSSAYGTWKWEHDGVSLTQFQFAQDASGDATGLTIIHRRMHFTGPYTVAGYSSVSFCNLHGQNCVTPPALAHFTGRKIRAAGPD